MKYKFLFLLLFVVFGGSRAAFAHNYHTSITDVKYNPRSQSLEVAVKVFTDDLESALSRRAKKDIHYSNSAAVKQQLSNYLHSTLAFALQPGKPLAYTLLGSEEEDDAIWLYIEVPLKQATLPQLYVKNAVLMDTFSDQMNIVNISYKGKTESMLLQKDEQEKKVSF
ncbi:hypothetical protein I2I11_08640 [Pontibacter sp. 172403-2]|uniref:DUF6702 family protein n=1 Tax=Pontibacter rufus TaxID=2791028 RepID=UPI0018AFC05A|nr:DUF6702 family protein [Pontibacter sp. 172403-2]MBF9253357.1 hypothetical protein [Pontibacter sp. 172403-2]